MEERDSSSGFYRRHMEADGQSFVGTSEVELREMERCQPIHEMDDSQLVGVPVEVTGDSGAGGEETPAPLAVEVKTGFELGESGGGKRKRGRPPRGQGKPPSPKRTKEEEEDVCFICFDGGSLVLCDRKGCPKAYHPACIKRDEAFFRSKAKWNCGWHICSVCRKAAHYMCYTCTYSLCKGCTKDADYVCVRGNKGFCTTCMRTIMMIENKEQVNEEMAQVDFDDKSSWEYLFKVYWVYLKEKLSLTFDELTQAKNPWKGAGTVACKELSHNVYNGANECKTFVSDRSFGALELNNSRRKITNKQPELLQKDSLSTGKPNTGLPKLLNCLANREVGEKFSCLNGNTEWASKELLEFVAHMKNGDTSVLSQFDVQALLLDYIKRNNLRDPHRKSQIVCDSRLKNLFSKPRVGHFEMLKLLEFHFLIKDDYQKNVVPAGFVNTVASQVEADRNNGNVLMMAKKKRRKTRRKGEERVLQTNLGEYAAIDVHNINLIYLRRNLMEGLVEDNNDFHDKVVGSIVRIRISCSDQKQEMYRLVQVVGTCKVAVPYKIGNKTADVMLEVLNLDKKEAISIDVISNQEFSEDECRRLRQSVKCGLVKYFTVGEVQKKAMALQAVRLSDWLETEILRLNHLRDRASEKGHKKELREYVEKLELLKTPEERQRRLHEIPEVHVDPKMDPSYQSEDDAGNVDDKKQDVKRRPIYSGFGRKGCKQISQHTTDKKESSIRDMERLNEGEDACRLNILEKLQNQVDSTNSALGGWNDQDEVRFGSCSITSSETSSTPLSTGNVLSANNGETNKIWHYRDPKGKIQGPFAMFQLRKWSTTGFFPPDMRIWTSDEQNDSVLLTDALNGQFQRALLLTCNISLQIREDGGSSDGRLCNTDVGWSKTMDATRRNSEKDGARHCNDARLHLKGNNEIRGDGLGSQSSDRITATTNYKEGQAASCLAFADYTEEQAASCSLYRLKGSNCGSDQPEVHSPLPLSTLSEQSKLTLSQQERGHESEKWNPVSKQRNCDPNVSSVYQTAIECNNENQYNCEGHSSQSSGQNWKSLPANFCPSNSETDFDCATLTMSTDSSKQRGEINAIDLPSSTPKTCNKDWDFEVTGSKESITTCISIQDSDALNLPSPTPIPRTEDQKGEAAESKQSVLSNIPVQDSGPSWGSASSLVSGAQLPETADEWEGYSPNTEKPSVEEWDSCLISSMNSSEVLSDHVATSTSRNDQFNHSSPSQPASNLCTWSEPIEFSTLAEESVSDLLAEVDAIESQGGLASPTSVMICDEELLQDSKHGCFSSIEELSPPDTGKSDALSSTGDIQLHCQSTATDNPVGAFLADAFEYAKRSSGQSTTSAEVDEETKSTDVPVSLGGACLEIEPPVSLTMGRELVNSNIARRVGSEATHPGWRTRQGNMNLSLGVSAQGITNIGWETGQALARGSVNMNSGILAETPAWESQRKYGGERCGGTREWAFQGVDSGFSRNGHLWSRQLYGSSSGQGGVYSRPPKGQRVCKFYESGRCKKGAMCGYLHP